jgi:transcriptional regulator of acetoin/glycerol metabolism
MKKEIMIIEVDKVSQELQTALRKEVAALMQIDPDQLILHGIVVQLHDGAYNLNQTEKKILLQAYVASAGSISKTAALLGVTRKTVYNLLKKHQIDSLIYING